ncbi:homeobox protein ATH1-like [Salvia divinorum]|uniref:Homeobox protein ATH1-like n=1 Tax=Salvia divinorum TaxID=28513 RepID=A0ABD1FNT2_SALDI
MQTDAATGPHAPVAADGSSMHSALISPCYSDLVTRHIQNRIMAGIPLPPAFGDELWTTGKYIEGISSNPTGSSYTFQSPNACMSSAFEAGFGGLPYDASTRWDFNGGVPSPELQESSIMMDEWMLMEHERLNPNPGPSRFNKELPLSLATSHPRIGVASELSSTGMSSYSSLHVGSDNTSCSSSNAMQLSGSRFFQPMQEILAEFASYALENCDGTSLGCSDGLEHSSVSHNNNNNEFKKRHLMSLLQLVDDQYNQCLDEIHTVVSAFHAVTELDPNLHARFTLPTVSAMYRGLRERISSHILAMGAARRDEGENRLFETTFIQKQWALQQLKKRDHQLWRPQRGLPERSVSVLRAWMFQNFLHPYPKDAEKHLLALKSGLTRSQVSNWFINARVRLWKPMIEEMYAEMNRRKAPRNQEDANGIIHRKLLRFDSRRFDVD